MIDFLQSNYEKLISITSLVVCFVISCFNSVKAKRAQKSVEVVSAIAEIVAEVESVLPNGFGSVKLAFVLRQIEKLCAAYHLPFDKSFYSEQVEKVLSAPSKSMSKKEVSDE